MNSRLYCVAVALNLADERTPYADFVMMVAVQARDTTTLAGTDQEHREVEEAVRERLRPYLNNKAHVQVGFPEPFSVAHLPQHRPSDGMIVVEGVMSDQDKDELRSKFSGNG